MDQVYRLQRVILISGHLCWNSARKVFLNWDASSIWGFLEGEVCCKSTPYTRVHYSTSLRVEH